MLLCLTLKWTSWQVDELTSCLLTYLLVNLVTLSLFTSNLFTRLTRLLVNHRKLNSQTENQKGVNSVPINALLACKRCSLRPLLTPFWSLIKHLFLCCFITNWFPFSYKPTFYMCFAVIYRCLIRTYVMFFRILICGRSPNPNWVLDHKIKCFLWCEDDNRITVERLLCFYSY